MNPAKKRKPITIHFHYDKESGEKDLTIDDNTPNASEDLHDKIAKLIAQQLGVNPIIEDAGPARRSTGVQKVRESEGPQKSPRRKTIKQ